MENKQLTTTLNDTVSRVLSASALQGFEKAFLIAEAAGKLKHSLTSEYMKPIMELQNNRLGFKTDKQQGYEESVVKNCLIEAVLTGVQPFGNQFNIIAGNCYITKEGFGYLLSKVPGLTYEIIPALPRISQDKNSAAIVMKIEWSLNGNKQSREIDFPIKVNQYMGADAVIGKATRKARAWLYSVITGMEIGDGDVQDIDHRVVEQKPIQKTTEEKEAERVGLLILGAKTVQALNELKPHVSESQLPLFNERMVELQKQK